MSPMMGYLHELVPRRNDALKNNPPTGAQAHITTRSSDWLWCVFAIYLFVDLCLFVWCVLRPAGTRLMNQLAILILTIGTWAYFAQASNLGWTVTPTSFKHYTSRGTLRQVFWARYVDWILTALLLLVMMTMLTGVHWRDVMATCFAGAIVWIGWLLASLIGPSQYKWAYYVFALVMGMFYVWYSLLGPVYKSAKRLGGKYQTLALINGILYSFMLVMYAIAWGCTSGGNNVSNSSEAVWFGILDLFSKPFYLIFFLWWTINTDYHLLRESRYSHARGDYGDQGQRYFPHDARAHHAATHLTAHHVGNTVVGGAVGGSIAAAVGGPGVVDHGQGGHGPSHDNERVHHHHAHADAEKAAAKRGTGIFARRGAHDDPDAPAEGGRFFDRFKKRKPDGTVFPPVGDEAEAPADADIAENRISNATMVDINEDYHTPGTHFPHEPVVHPIPAAEEAYLDSNPNPDSAVPVHPTPAAGQVHPNPAVHPNDTPVVPSTKH